MSGTAKVLDDEFLFLASLLQPVFAALPEHRDEVRLWLERLFLVPALVDSARRDRNEYLARLYHGAMSGQLDAVFLDEPPEGALRPPEDVFPSLSATAWLDDVEAGASQPATPQGAGDADERTYLATQVLPEGRGAFGYLAVSLAHGGPHWQDGSKGHQGAGTPRWGRAEPQATSTPLEATTPTGTDTNTAAQGEGLSAVLEGRAPAEQRQQLLHFYDSLIGDLDQALCEPERTNPELEKILASFKRPTGAQGSSAGADTSGASPRQAELVSQLRERLVERRSRAEQRSLALDSLELELSQAAEPQPYAQRAPRRAPCIDEDAVWNIKPENVALLEGAYPRQLVLRFLDGVVRERVAVLGRVRARRYYHNHVEGLETDAAEDMEHYHDGMEAWAGVLRRDVDDGQGGSATADDKAAVDAALQAERCAELAGKATSMMKELGAARQEYFDKEESQQGVQERLRAEIELLRAEEAVLKRRLHQMLGRASK